MTLVHAYELVSAMQAAAQLGRAGSSVARVLPMVVQCDGEGLTVAASDYMVAARWRITVQGGGDMWVRYVSPLDLRDALETFLPGDPVTVSALQGGLRFGSASVLSMRGDWDRHAEHLAALFDGPALPDLVGAEVKAVGGSQLVTLGRCVAAAGGAIGLDLDIDYVPVRERLLGPAIRYRTPARSFVAVVKTIWKEVAA